MDETQGPSDTSTSATRAARPNTSAPEINAAMESPSSEKKTASIEREHSVDPPEYDPVAANMAEPAVEGVAKQRVGETRRGRSEPGFKAPELLNGQPLGPNERRVPEDPDERLQDKPATEEGKSVGNTGSEAGSPSTSASAMRR